MSVQLGNYSFEGEFASIDSLHERSGVYAVLGITNAYGGRRVIDIGESGGVWSRVKCHDRALKWPLQRLPLRYAALYCDERTRMAVEQQLRVQYKPPCGDR